MTSAAVSHALVLTAGLGTRLRPLTLVRAKPAIPVAGQPIIRRIVEWLVANGVSEITLNLHHLPETITAIVGDGSDLNAAIRYSWEQPTVLGSAGGPRQALDIIGADTFFVINGDTLTDLNLGALADAHRDWGALVTMALVPNMEPHRYGGVRLGADGAVLGFVPRGPAAKGSFHFIGAQIAHRSVFETLPPAQPVNSVGDCYDRLIARQPGGIRGLVTNASFWDIGTVADYWTTSLAWSSDATRSILWNNVMVDPGAVLDECIVTDNVHVASGAQYHKQILRRAPDGTLIVEPLALP